MFSKRVVRSCETMCTTFTKGPLEYIFFTHTDTQKKENVNNCVNSGKIDRREDT